jgi:hypothetical protein
MKLQRCKIIFLLAISLSFSPEIQAQGRTPTTVVRTTSATEVAGIRKSTWIFSSDFVGSVLGRTGAPYVAGASIDIDAPNGEILGPIVYTISAGSIIIVEIK